MSALKKTDTKPAVPVFENGIEENRQSIRAVDEYTFESSASICRRFDISESTLLRLIAKHRIKKHPIPGTSSVRYRTMDFVRLIDTELSNNGEENERP